MLFNGGGSQQYAADNGGIDPLLAEFQVNKGSFDWINHTWDHPERRPGVRACRLHRVRDHQEHQLGRPGRQQWDRADSV